MKAQYILYSVLALFLSTQLAGFDDLYIDRKLGHLSLSAIEKELISDYSFKMGSFRNWSKVKSLKLDGIITIKGKSYNCTLYKKSRNKIKLTIRDLNNSFTEITQILNGNESYSFTEHEDGTIRAIEPLFNLEEDKHLMPKLMDLIMHESDDISLIIKAQDEKKLLQLKYTIDGQKTYEFDIDKETKYLTQYRISDKHKDIRITLEGLLKSDQLSYPKKITLSMNGEKAELLFHKFSHNLGLPPKFFNIPENVL